MRSAKEHGVILIIFAPTHESQPLDCGAFGLKVVRNLPQILPENPGKVITKFNFNKLFSEA